MSRYFNWASSLNRFVRFDTARSDDVNGALDELTAGLDSLDLDVNRSIKLPNGTADQTLALGAGARANKVLAFDASGNVTVSANDVDTTAASASAAAASAASASSSAATATSQAALATTNGATQVALATTQKQLAADQAAIATAQAVIATTKAAEAAASAASIAGGPVTSVNGLTGIVSLRGQIFFSMGA